MHALVTGGAGFIGSHLCEALSKQGWPVTILDNFSSGSKQNIQQLLDDIPEQFIYMRVTAPTLRM
jgi:nucleoside-diphosphate-sugar epimerase